MSMTAAMSALHHRGPDADGQRTVAFAKASCELGHTRLRIIDLSPEADQPLANEDGTVWVVYNGELYNHRELRADLEAAGHRFRSRSDTEVLVHLWEHVGGRPEPLLNRLRGMFAFAIVDTERGRVLLGRDRLGIKPLYWSKAGGRLVFASEARALVDFGASRADPDLGALSGYLLWGVIAGPATAYTDVHELPPGSCLEWANGKDRVLRWYTHEPHPDVDLASDAERVLRAALRDAVARHLVADRPVGVFLSGGTDSAAVASLGAAEGELRTLTVTFPEGESDESSAAFEISRRLGVPYDPVPVTGGEVASALPEILAGMDQPTADGVNTWLVSRAARQAGLVVALSGLGGDELFGGYPSFRLVPRLARVLRLASALPAPLRRAMAGVLGHRNPSARGARLLAAEPDAVGAYVAVRGHFALNELPPEAAASIPDPDLPATATKLEMAHYLPNQLLRDTDSMSMAHSLEVRVPLLDDNVVRVATHLPDSVRLAPGKALLARAAGIGRSPEKRPFTLPFDRWLRGPLHEPLRRGLLSDDLPLAGLVPAELRRRTWSAFATGRTHWSGPWGLAVLRLWAEHRGLAW
jgi:asparagine synthase (glutamine-hydrolysing)